MGNKLGRRRHVVDEKYTRPQWLYQHEDVDCKKLRKLILDSKLAPCYPGAEGGFDLEECPICFLYYPSLNRSRCCMKGMCTECFLQMKTLNSTQPAPCPFCKSLNYAVEYRGAKTKEEKGMEQIEEQRVIEAKIRMRQQELKDEEERMRKRQELCSSSQVVGPDEVEHGSVAVPAYNCSIEGDKIVSSQDSCAGPVIGQPSCTGQNRCRDNEFDLELEEFMVMAAIQLSIQENGRHQNPGHATSSGQYVGEDPCLSAATVLPTGVLSSPSFSLACATAALVENQQMGGESSGTYSGSTSVCHDMLPGCSRFFNRDGRHQNPDYGNAASSEQYVGEGHCLSAATVLPAEASSSPAGGFTCAIAALGKHQPMGGESSGNYTENTSGCHDMVPVPRYSRFFNRDGRHKKPGYGNATSSEQYVGAGASSPSSGGLACSVAGVVEQHQTGGESSGNLGENRSACHDMLPVPRYSRFFNRDGRHQNPDYGNAASSEQYVGAEASSSLPGGLSCAIAALVEHQQMGGESSGNYSGNTSACHDMLPGCCRFFNSDGRHQNSDYVNAGSSEQYLGGDHCVSAATLMPAEASPSSLSGGLACAISTFTEQQQMGGESSNKYCGYTSACPDMLPGCSRFFYSDVQVPQNYPSVWNSIEVLPDSRLALNSDRQWGMQHGSGYGYRGSDAAEEPCRNTVFVPQHENGAFHPVVAPLFPESFEEQMMLNMAVSLAEARARTSAPGVAWY